MKLDLAPLVNAIARLEEGLEAYARDETQTLIRDGLVQRVVAPEHSHALSASSTRACQGWEQPFLSPVRECSQLSVDAKCEESVAKLGRRVHPFYNLHPSLQTGFVHVLSYRPTARSFAQPTRINYGTQTPGESKGAS